MPTLEISLLIALAAQVPLLGLAFATAFSQRKRQPSRTVSTSAARPAAERPVAVPAVTEEQAKVPEAIESAPEPLLPLELVAEAPVAAAEPPIAAPEATALPPKQVEVPEPSPAVAAPPAAIEAEVPPPVASAPAREAVEPQPAVVESEPAPASEPSAAPSPEPAREPVR